MSYKFIDDRQVINRAALPNIGVPANDTLDDILSRINNFLGSSQSYIAKKVSLTSGSTSYTVTIPTKPDTSYIVLAIMGNTTDSHPQYQQIEVTAKSTSGFTFTWGNALDSNNYFIDYIVPSKTFPEVEAAIGSGVNSLASTLPISQPFSGYGVIGQLQNIVDPNPQFQSIVIGSNTNSTVNLLWNVNTDSANYQAVYMVGATGQNSISNSSTSVTVNLPINFNTTNYAIIGTIQNTVDPNPQFQPMIISNLSSNSATFSWNVARDSGNYLLNWYAISLTP
jgi:hypothetical protein